MVVSIWKLVELKMLDFSDKTFLLIPSVVFLDLLNLPRDSIVAIYSSTLSISYFNFRIRNVTQFSQSALVRFWKSFPGVGHLSPFSRRSPELPPSSKSFPWQTGSRNWSQPPALTFKMLQPPCRSTQVPCRSTQVPCRSTQIASPSNLI